MLSRAKKHWRLFARAQPGTRFEKLHDARAESAALRIVVSMIGILLLAGGVVLLFIPGPGLLLIAFGAGLLAQQSRWLAKRLDRLEILLRRLASRARSFWKRAATPLRAGIVAAGVLVCGAAAWAAYAWLSRN
jgi:putative transmembrane protein PGPGW